jgi:SAM-dependent methyltransferase
MAYMMSGICPLCSSSAEQYHQDTFRSYVQCRYCRLVFVQPEAILSAKKEKSRYDLHQNSPHDTGYRKFLSRICDPIITRLPVGSRGLDFGCGPGPTLTIIFEELGYPMALYDPFYAADEAVLEIAYDFVTATEVAEHLQNPKESFELMWRCVKPGGYLGIMTKLVIDKDAFTKWHYIRDETHICFYSKETFLWLAEQWRTEPVFLGSDTILFQKNSVPGKR